MGWSEKLSANAANSNSCSLETRAGWTAVTWNVPRVNVPVLSKTTVSV